MTPDADVRGVADEAAETAGAVGAGVEKSMAGVAGITGLVKELSTTLYSLAQNPMIAQHYAGLLGEKLKNSINNELKNTNKYTRDQVDLLQKLAREAPNVMKVAGSITAVGLAAVESYRGLVKLSNEMGKFTTAGRMPFGAGTPKEAIQSIRNQYVKDLGSFTKEIADTRALTYEQMLPYMTPGMTKGPGGTEAALHLAVLGKRLGLENVGGEYAELMREQGKRGLKGDVAASLMINAMHSAYESPGTFGTGAEAFKSIISVAKTLQKTTNMPFAQAMNAAMMMPSTMGQFGMSPEEIANLTASIVPGTAEAKKRLMQQSFGLRLNQNLGAPGALAENMFNIRQWGMKETGGRTAKTELNIAQQGLLNTKLSQMGIAEESFWDLMKAETLNIPWKEFHDKVQEGAKLQGDINGKLKDSYMQLEGNTQKERSLMDVYHYLKNGAVNLMGETMGRELGALGASPLTGESLITVAGGGYAALKASKYLKTKWGARAAARAGKATVSGAEEMVGLTAEHSAKYTAGMDLAAVESGETAVSGAGAVAAGSMAVVGTLAAIAGLVVLNELVEKSYVQTDQQKAANRSRNPFRRTAIGDLQNQQAVDAIKRGFTDEKRMMIKDKLAPVISSIYNPFGASVTDTTPLPAVTASESPLHKLSKMSVEDHATAAKAEDAANKKKLAGGGEDLHAAVTITVLNGAGQELGGTEAILAKGNKTPQNITISLGGIGNA